VQGETLNTIDSFIKNGGKGANQAVAASKLGAQTLFAGQFGKDKFGDDLEEDMKQA
jgi:ribokinase